MNSYTPVLAWAHWEFVILSPGAPVPHQLSGRKGFFVCFCIEEICTEKDVWPIEVGVGVVRLGVVYPVLQQSLATAVASQVPFRPRPLWQMIPVSVRSKTC